MKRHIYRWTAFALTAAGLSSCYYYPVADGTAAAPYYATGNSNTDEKSGSVPVYDAPYTPEQPVTCTPGQPVVPVPVVPPPAFTVGVALPPIIFGHGHCHGFPRHHGRHHHPGHHH